MKKRVIATVLACVMGMGLLTGCGSTADSSTTNNSAATESKTEGSAAASNEDLSGTITFAIWDNNLNDFIESNDMVGKFQEKYPDIDIEIEKIKDDSEYWNAMKMRASANQLPDAEDSAVAGALADAASCFSPPRSSDIAVPVLLCRCRDLWR